MIKANDVVKHIPSGEIWVVCGVNYKTNNLIPSGYPFPTIAKLNDCELIERSEEPQTLKQKEALIKVGCFSFIEEVEEWAKNLKC